MKYLRVRDVKQPERGTELSAGIDLFIPNDFPTYTLQPGHSVFIPSGIKAKVPAGHALIFFNKSGIAAKRNLMVGACVVDEDYQGEMHLDLKNVGTEAQVLEAGSKITQMVCIPVNYVSLEEASSEEELFEGEITERGEGRTGSTGV